MADRLGSNVVIESEDSGIEELDYSPEGIARLHIECDVLESAIEHLMLRWLRRELRAEFTALVEEEEQAERVAEAMAAIARA